MAVMRVNPNRMELTRLKRQLATATRGHKLLKDKRDEMMRRFLELVRETKEMREEVEKELSQALSLFLLARAVNSDQVLEEALVYPSRRVSVRFGVENIMSVRVPAIKQLQEETVGSSDLPYGFAETSAELDEAISTLNKVFRRMLELAEVEKKTHLLADEIEKTRRRVNALEYVLIPRLQETIRYISMKLDENERGNLTRLMKVKEIVGAG